MTQIVSNIIQKSFEGFVAGAVSTVGGYAGDAIAGLGNLVESTGDSIGNGIVNKVDGWGQSISGNTSSSTITTGHLAPGKSLPKGFVVQKTATASRSQSLASPKTLQRPKSKVGITKPKTIRANSNTTTTTKTGSANSIVKKQNTATTKTGAYPKASTYSDGKVIPQKSSLPPSKKQASISKKTAPKSINPVAYKGPIPIGNAKPSGGYEPWKSKARDGYQGPLQLGGLA